jgi:hypothetical protein
LQFGSTEVIVTRPLPTLLVPRTVGSTLFMCLLEPAAFIMTRRMLLGLKRRAETTGAQQHDAAKPAA